MFSKMFLCVLLSVRESAKDIWGGSETRRRRRRNRDAESVEGEGNGEEVPPVQPTRGPGERCKLPSAGSGADPRPKTGFGAF